MQKLKILLSSIAKAKSKAAINKFKDQLVFLCMIYSWWNLPWYSVVLMNIARANANTFGPNSKNSTFLYTKVVEN